MHARQSICDQQFTEVALTRLHKRVVADRITAPHRALLASADRKRLRQFFLDELRCRFAHLHALRGRNAEILSLFGHPFRKTLFALRRIHQIETQDVIFAVSFHMETVAVVRVIRLQPAIFPLQPRAARLHWHQGGTKCERAQRGPDQPRERKSAHRGLEKATRAQPANDRIQTHVALRQPSV